MNSSFQKSPDLSEETIHLSELGRHKKAEPKLDELRKVLGEVLGDEEFDADEEEGEYDYDEKRICLSDKRASRLQRKSRKKITARKF